MRQSKNKVERQREKIAKLKERNEALQKRKNDIALALLRANHLIDDVLKRGEGWVFDDRLSDHYMGAIDALKGVVNE